MVEIAIPDKYVHLPEWVDPKPFMELPLLVRHITTAMANEYREPYNIYFSTDRIMELLHPLWLIEGYDQFLEEDFMAVHRGPRAANTYGNWIRYLDICTGVCAAITMSRNEKLTRGYSVASRSLQTMREDFLRMREQLRHEGPKFELPVVLIRWLTTLDKTAQYIEDLLIERSNPPKFGYFQNDIDSRCYHYGPGYRDVFTPKYKYPLWLPEKESDSNSASLSKQLKR